MLVNFDISRIRGGSVSADFSVGRGGSLGTPKKTFGQKLSGLTAPGTPVGVEVLTELDSLHSQIRTTGDVARMCDLLDRYVVLVAATFADAQSKPMPAGSLMAALITAIKGARPSGNTAGPTSPF